jgi:serine/threonine kinase PknH
MANPVWITSYNEAGGPIISPTLTPGPCNGLVTPVRYRTEALDDRGGLSDFSYKSDPDRPPVTNSVLWKKVKRNLFFWQTPTEVVQVSVFGPAAVSPGQSAKVWVYFHAPAATESIHIQSGAFQHNAKLIGSGYMAREVAYKTELGVHLSMANAGVSRSLLTFVWRGQPRALVFDLHVPWESPGGPAPGLVSIGRDKVRIGTIAFHLMLLPRKV